MRPEEILDPEFRKKWKPCMIRIEKEPFTGYTRNVPGWECVKCGARYGCIDPPGECWKCP